MPQLGRVDQEVDTVSGLDAVGGNILLGRLPLLLLVCALLGVIGRLDPPLDRDAPVVPIKLRALDRLRPRRHLGVDAVSYTHLTLPTIYSV